MNLPKRKPTRLNGFDYSSPSAYFVTICTHNRKCLFSIIVGAIHESPLRLNEIRHRSVLSKVIGYIKMNSSKQIHFSYNQNVWQRNYHDHIIRGDKDYENIWKYIDENIYNWEKDCFYAD